jgi:formate dehydrogenase major subunit
VWWDPAAPNAPNAATGAATPAGKWVGYDVPDFSATKAPNTPARPGAVGLDALSGTDPFILKADGRGWLFVPTGLVDGPLPTHYEPIESPVRNLLYPRQQVSPVHKHWARGKAYNQLAQVGDARYPHIITTYRLTEHYLAGAMSRWLPWLAQLMPEPFVEIGRALAAEKGIETLDWVRLRTPRAEVRARALVTDRIGVMTLGDRRVHHVGVPWHWGWEGLSTGDPANDLTAWIGDANVSMHEGKAFVCSVEKGE